MKRYLLMLLALFATGLGTQALADDETQTAAGTETTTAVSDTSAAATDTATDPAADEPAAVTDPMPTPADSDSN
jgi:hypothetical protein